MYSGPAVLATALDGDVTLWAVEVELLAECGSFLERGDALLSVLGDFGGTCGGVSSIFLILKVVRVSMVSCNWVLGGITNGVSSSRRFLVATPRTASSSASVVWEASDLFLGLVIALVDPRSICSLRSADIRRNVLSGTLLDLSMPGFSGW